jgi:hypothetical protein
LQLGPFRGEECLTAECGGEDLVAGGHAQCRTSVRCGRSEPLPCAHQRHPRLPMASLPRRSRRPVNAPER